MNRSIIIAQQPRLARIDRLAIGLSLLCVVHCLLTAALVASFATLGGLFSHQVHSVALVVALALGVVALGGGVLRHRRIGPVTVGFAGTALMGLALTMDHGAGEMWFTLAGVTLLAAAHWSNRRMVE